MGDNTNFDRAFAAVIGLEGGYVNDPRDPGGPGLASYSAGFVS